MARILDSDGHRLRAAHQPSGIRSGAHSVVRGCDGWEPFTVARTRQAGGLGEDVDAFSQTGREAAWVRSRSRSRSLQPWRMGGPVSAVIGTGSGG